MVFGMATTKITITLDEQQIKEIRALVTAERVGSVSGFVKHAVTVALHDAAGWREMLQDALRETGGPLTATEREWADSVLSSRPPRKHPRRGKAA
jgi:Arc/MetJ-type ribon-helix-helix transcriptional regulator